MISISLPPAIGRIIFFKSSLQRSLLDLDGTICFRIIVLEIMYGEE